MVVETRVSRASLGLIAAITVTLAGVTWQDQGQAISGEVVDLATQPDGTHAPIAGVWVHVFSTGEKLIGQAATNAMGRYIVKNLPLGKAKVSFQDPRYYVFPPPPLRETTVNAVSTATVDVEMVHRNPPDDSYYSRLGKGLVELARKDKSGDDVSRTYKDQWKQLREVGLPPRSKLLVCLAMVGEDPTVKTAVREIEEYHKSPPKAVERIHIAFKRAVQSKGPIPIPSSVDDLPLSVTLDIVAYVLDSEQQSLTQKEALYRGFTSAYGQSAALRLNKLTKTPFTIEKRALGETGRL